MNWLKVAVGVLNLLSLGSEAASIKSGIIGYGRQRQDGGHDHRWNKGGDRTPSQRRGDESRRK